MKGKDFVAAGYLTADGYDECILGVAKVVLDGVVVHKVIYDADAMVKQLAKEFLIEGISQYHAEEAAVHYLEFINFNVYSGVQTPLYVWRHEPAITE